MVMTRYFSGGVLDSIFDKLNKVTGQLNRRISKQKESYNNMHLLIFIHFCVDLVIVLDVLFLKSYAKRKTYNKLHQEAL